MSFINPIEKIILRHTLAYSVSKYLSQVLFLVRGFLVARLLGPTLFGLWQSMKLLLRFGEFTHMGTQSALNRELPLSVGRGDKKEEAELITGGLTSVFLTSSISALIILGISLTKFKIFEKVDLICLQMVACVLIFQQIFMFFSLISKLQKKFFIISVGESIFSLANLVLVVALIIFLGIFGLFLGMILSYGIGIAYLVRKCNYNFRLALSYQRFKSLVQIGFPIMLFFFLSSFFRSIDRLVVLIYLTKTDLGFYGLSSYAVDFIIFIPSIISSVIGPRLTEKFGQTNNIAYLEKHIFMPIDAISSLLPVVIGIIFLVIDPIVMTFLPNYTEGILAIKIISLGTFFYSISHLLFPAIVTFKKQKDFMTILAIGILTGALVNYMAIEAGYGITGVAVGMGIIFMIYCIVSLLYFSHLFNHKPISNIKYILKTFATFFYSILVLILIQFIDLGVKNILGEIEGILVNILLYLILMTPAIYVFEKRTGLIKKMLASIRKG